MECEVVKVGRGGSRSKESRVDPDRAEVDGVVEGRR